MTLRRIACLSAASVAVSSMSSSRTGATFFSAAMAVTASPAALTFAAALTWAAVGVGGVWAAARFGAHTHPAIVAMTAQEAIFSVLRCVVRRTGRLNPSRMATSRNLDIESVEPMPS